MLFVSYSCCCRIKHGCGAWDAPYRATGYGLRATGYGLRATGLRSWFRHTVIKWKIKILPTQIDNLNLEALLQFPHDFRDEATTLHVLFREQLGCELYLEPRLNYPSL